MAPEQERNEETGAETSGASAGGQQPAGEQAGAANAGAAAKSGSSTTASAEGEDVAELRAQLARLEQDLAEARERADRFHSNWQRSAADFQNWKRRTDQEKAELSRLAEAGLTTALLSVLDDFERGFVSLPPDLRSFTWIEGMYLIGQKLYALLQSRGLSPIEALGQEFDPRLHEAVLREEGSEGSDDLVIVQELQRGYRFHDRVIRATMVKVGTREAGQPSANEQTEAPQSESPSSGEDGGQPGTTGG